MSGVQPVSLRIPVDLHRQGKIVSQISGISFNSLLVTALENEIKRMLADGGEAFREVVALRRAKP